MARRSTPSESAARQRTRTFTVPAGTRLADGRTVAETIRRHVTYTRAEMSSGAAQKRARDLAFADVRAAYGAAAVPSRKGLQQATGREQKARGYKPAISGGRKRQPVGSVKDNYSGKVIYHELGKPKHIYKTIKQEVGRIFAGAPPGTTIAIHGRGAPVDKQDYAIIQWMSAPQVDSYGAFLYEATTARGFEDWVGIRLRGSEEWTITERPPRIES